jgi:hypothetical protein
MRPDVPAPGQLLNHCLAPAAAATSLGGVGSRDWLGAVALKPPCVRRQAARVSPAWLMNRLLQSVPGGALLAGGFGVLG